MKRLTRWPTTALLVGTLLISALLASAISLGVLFGTAEPAVAANSADELVNARGVRPFGGIDRYHTAAALADQLIASQSGSPNFVDTVIIAGGSRGAPDAMVASGLAGARNAAVLLTEPDRLHPLVRRFIERNLIDYVIVLGGTQAVSESVISELAEISHLREQNITRIAGSTRITTATAVASFMGEPGEYCDSGQVSAILVGAESLADAAAIAPLAYRSNLPILFAHRDSLMPEVGQYLATAEIEHLVVMGSTTELSEKVVAAAQAAAISTAVRIEGDDAGARSVALARALQQCITLAVSDRTFALVDSRNPVDAAAAGPPLGVGLGNTAASTSGPSFSLVPILLVDDTLPSTVSLLLEETPRQDSAENFVTAQLIAIGGTARLAPEVMEAALDAAATAPALTARISATVGTSTVLILFSDDVTDEDPVPSAGLAEHDVKNKNNYLVAGESLLSTDRFTTNGRVLTIELSDYMIQAGNTIEVVGDVIKGAANDNRTVQGARAVAIKQSPDSMRPLLRLELAENAPSMVVLVIEANPFGASSKALEVVDITVTRVGGENVPLAVDGIVESIDGLRYRVDLQGDLRLQAGDEVRVAADAVKDAGGRGNRSLRATVGANSSLPRVITATIAGPETLTDPGPDGVLGSLDDVLRNARLQVAQVMPSEPPAGEPAAAWVACAIDLADSISADSISAGATSGSTAGADENCEPEFELRARTIGRESGVLGNRWSLQLIYDAVAGTNGVDEVTVEVSTTRAVISVIYGDEAKVSDVIEALRSNNVAVSRFEILDANEATDPLLRVEGAASLVAFRFGGGASRAEIVLTYNEVLAQFNAINTASTEAEPAINNANFSATPEALVGCAAFAASVQFEGDPRAGGDLKAAQTNPAFTGISDDSIVWSIRYDPPSRTAVITLTSSTDELPTSANTMVLPPGLGVNFDCVASSLEKDQRLRKTD